MAGNPDALVLWKDFKYPNGMNADSVEEFESRILAGAQKAGMLLVNF